LSRYTLSDDRITEIIAEVAAEQAAAITPSTIGACCSCCGRMFPEPTGSPTECQQCLEAISCR
jgi:hypothetical protein